MGAQTDQTRPVEERKRIEMGVEPRVDPWIAVVLAIAGIILVLVVIAEIFPQI